VDWRAWQVSFLWCGRTTIAQVLAAPACSSRSISDPAALAAAGPTGLDGADILRAAVEDVHSRRRCRRAGARLHRQSAELCAVKQVCLHLRLYRPFQHHDLLAIPPRLLLDWRDN